jgi:hypothetical protein
MSDEEATEKRSPAANVKDIMACQQKSVKNIVIHSLFDLGGETAPDFAEAFINTVAQRPRNRLSSLDNTFRLLLRVEPQRLRRQLGEGLERDTLTP